MVEIEGAGHWPQLDDPELFAEELIDFIEDTEPYHFDLDRMREQLREGPSPRSSRTADAHSADGGPR